MGTNSFLGTATAVAQVNTITPANVTVGNIFTVTIHGISISFTATAATVANVTAGLVAAINASTAAEWLEVTAADITTALTLTAKVAGKPFTQTSSAAQGTGSAGMTLTTSTTTASSGPNHWDTAANWSLGTVPVNADDVLIDNLSVDILYGLSQSGVTLASLTVTDTFTGKIGLPRYTGSYFEYRPQYLAISATIVKIGKGNGSGQGSQRIKLDTGANQTTVTVMLTASGIETGIEAFLWKGTHASNLVQVVRGSVGVAVFPGETATVATLDVAYLTSVDSDANVRCGAGVAWTTVSKSGGFLQLASGGGTILQLGGRTKLEGDTLNVTTLKAEGGTVLYSCTGTITNLSVAEDAEFNTNGDLRAKTVTNCDLYGDEATIIDDYKTVAWTNGINLKFTGTKSTRLRIGTNINVAVTAL